MFVVLWFAVTSIALPVFVVLESTWIQDNRVRLKAVRIDAVLAIAWFLVFWIVCLHSQPVVVVTPPVMALTGVN
jgi:hypothetical protein